MSYIEFLKMDPQRASTEEAIISILSEKWPLTAKEIYNILKCQYNKDFSYQAVHKKLSELENSNVLVKDEREYALNKQWIANQKRFVARVEKAYSTMNTKYKLESDFTGSVTWKFNSLTTLAMTLGDLADQNILTGSKYYNLVAKSQHLYWPLKFSFKDYELCMSVGKKCKPLIVAKGNTPFDKWIKKYYELAGWGAVKIGYDFPGDDDLIVQGEGIIQIKYSPETAELKEKLYNKINNVYDLFKEYVHKTVAKTNVSVEMKITKNPEMADMLRKQILSYFK